MNLTRFVAVLTFAASFGWTTAVQAIPFSGTFSNDNDVVLFNLSVTGSSAPVITSTGYAAGGFRPYLSLFDGGGAFITSFGNTIAPFDFSVNLGTDSQLFGLYNDGAMLFAGNYILALTQFDNSAANATGPYVYDGSPNFTNTVLNECPGGVGQFCLGQIELSGMWSLEITGLGPNDAISQQAVPEPLSLALLGIGLAGLGFSRRRS